MDNQTLTNNNNLLGSDRFCLKCKTNSTPLWRRGPDKCILCNACGIQYKKLLKIFNENNYGCEHQININPFSLILSVFMGGVYYTIPDLKFILIALFSFPVVKDNTFTFSYKGFTFSTDEKTFLKYHCSNCPQNN
ncbi:hypothetical protein DICPUDRAFT_84315 [Dictyostelium purpureum]|uniref:GATA-type domain-containing protein n=1 Tax=Dictyostelium purpureum TaxID=5786 RepID=F1A293_DICPU|nr:uncharacterized protein DICPUDRAFT_84315 [Dictyostelium purpureum]EGC29684.1 hypothetical protein DICPUDRAFT_84315 [Dictyostelium purpureum]|eukprot:XP_003293789.1 hypothetical protein DICPUDRAFT_84315 [Dictyostelium purpureum]